MLRCVGLPGDKLGKKGFVYIDGNKNVLPDRARIQHSYIAYSIKVFPPKNFLN